LTQQSLALVNSAAAPMRGAARPKAEDRLVGLVEAHLPNVWRFVRRLGVPEHDVDDVVQEVILIVARKLDAIATGSERAFMMSTAYRVAADFRRARTRRVEVDVDDAHELADPTPGPDALADQHRARELLDQVLDAMPMDLRAVFVLYELDGFTMAEIAETFELAPGTVASRLRRGRELFEARIGRLEKRLGRGGDA
jgi:RNA polymerase sigma-70 factor (ECF subfamily)